MVWQAFRKRKIREKKCKKSDIVGFPKFWTSRYIYLRSYNVKGNCILGYTGIE